MNCVDFYILTGLTLSDVTVNYDSITFNTTCGRTFNMFHEQDCCEQVKIEDICGDIGDIIGSPITEANEARSRDFNKRNDDESATWTFYHLGTGRGKIVIRWLGTSNGYYSESVSLYEMTETAH